MWFSEFSLKCNHWAFRHIIFKKTSFIMNLWIECGSFDNFRYEFLSFLFPKNRHSFIDSFKLNFIIYLWQYSFKNDILHRVLNNMKRLMIVIHILESISNVNNIQNEHKKRSKKNTFSMEPNYKKKYNTINEFFSKIIFPSKKY